MRNTADSEIHAMFTGLRSVAGFFFMSDFIVRIRSVTLRDKPGIVKVTLRFSLKMFSLRQFKTLLL